jgi:hypothetical protein
MKNGTEYKRIANHGRGTYDLAPAFTQRVAVRGNTFPVKDKIKALGGRWDGTQRAWMVPVATAPQALALVGKPVPSPSANDQDAGNEAEARLYAMEIAEMRADELASERAEALRTRRSFGGLGY